MKVMMLAALVAALQPATYVVHAQMPRGESVSATVRLADADSTMDPPIREIVAAANAVAQASIQNKSSAQIMLGPQRTCVNLAVTTRGGTVVASGTASLPPPPDDRGPGPGPRGDANVNVRITETIDHQQLASARGNIGPAGNGRGPHFTWSLTKTGE